MNDWPLLYTAVVIGLFAAMAAFTVRVVVADYRRDRAKRAAEKAEAAFSEVRIDALAHPSHPYWSDWETEVSPS